MSQADLLVNLAFVPRQPTGLAVYALNILPYLGLITQAVLALRPLATPQTVTPLAYDHRRYQRLDLPRQPYLLYLGGHPPYKNLARLIQAFAQLPAGAADLELWIGGGCPPSAVVQRGMALALLVLGGCCNCR